MSAAYDHDWAPPSRESAVSYARGLARAYRNGVAAAALPDPRCPYAYSAHVQSWSQGVADGLADRARRGAGSVNA